jgi:hypothetical protein
MDAGDRLLDVFDIIRLMRHIAWNEPVRAAGKLDADHDGALDERDLRQVFEYRMMHIAGIIPSLVLMWFQISVLAAIGVALWLILGGDDDPTPSADSGTPATSPPSSSAETTTSSSSQETTTSSEETTQAPSGIPPATITPDGLGDDPTLNEFAQQCYDGSMVACDSLFIVAEDGSSYKEYADTCAGRQPAGTQQYCTISFPGG